MEAAGERQERLDALLMLIKENGGAMMFGELHAKAESQWGLTEKALWGYVDTLRDAERLRYPEFWEVAAGGPKGPLIMLSYYTPPRESSEYKDRGDSKVRLLEPFRGRNRL